MACIHEWEFINKGKTRLACKLCGLRGKFFRGYDIERDDKGLPTKMVWTGDYVVADAKAAK